MQVQRLCREAGVALECVQPLVSHIAREQEDYTGHKRDEPDAVLIARLASELHCYVPEEATAPQVSSITPPNLAEALLRWSVAIRETADGAHRPSWRPDAVRYSSADTATQRSTALQGDTHRDREETARIAENPQLSGRFPRVWQVLCGRCWVRTNVG
jgi:hypothetical protein